MRDRQAAVSPSSAVVRARRHDLGCLYVRARIRGRTALEDFPLASVIISGAITTVLMGIILWTVRRNRKQRRGESETAHATAAPADQTAVTRP
jgi:hypothetical protein